MVFLMYIEAGESLAPGFGVVHILVSEWRLVIKIGSVDFMCCTHLGKCTHCTVLHALGLVHGNDLEVCKVELYICVCV